MRKAIKDFSVPVCENGCIINRAYNIAMMNNDAYGAVGPGRMRP